jgi:hypothetical protein
METPVYACKAHENPESGIWGIGSGRGTSLLCLFVDIKRERSGGNPRVCTTFGLGLFKTESDTSNIHEGEVSGAKGTFVCRTNDFSTFGEGQLLG